MSDKHAQFVDKLGEIHGSFERLSIDHRVIGSVAVAAHGILPLQFERQSLDPIEQIPDVDVIVPRGQLAGAREVRERILNSGFPVKVGLAVPSLQIDMGYGPTSRLTLGRKSVDVDSSIFDAVAAEYMEVPVTTVSPETLRHIYSSLSPADSKYTVKLNAFDDKLGPDVGHDDDDPLAAFHDYWRLMQTYTPLSRRAMNVYSNVARHLPPEVAVRTRQLGMRAASLIGWR